MGLIDGLVKSLVSRCFKEFFLEELFLESSCTCFGRTKKKKNLILKVYNRSSRTKLICGYFGQIHCFIKLLHYSMPLVAL